MADGAVSLNLHASCYFDPAATAPLDSLYHEAATAPLGAEVVPLTPLTLVARARPGGWIFDYTDVGEPHITTPATSYEYIGENVSGWPDTPALLTIACDAEGNWVSLVTWRNIWPWGDADVLVRHRLGAGDWTHDAWTRWPQDILASASHWSTGESLVAEATAAAARVLSIALYQRASWESAEQLAGRTGLGHSAGTAALLARAEYSLRGMAEALEHLDDGRAQAP